MWLTWPLTLRKEIRGYFRTKYLGGIIINLGCKKFDVSKWIHLAENLFGALKLGILMASIFLKSRDFLDRINNCELVKIDHVSGT